MYRAKRNKKQVRVIGDYQSDSGNEYNDEENYTENDDEGGAAKSQKSAGGNSEYSKKGSMTPKNANKDNSIQDGNQKEDISPKSSRKDQSSPKSSKKEAESPTLNRNDSSSPSKKQTKSQNKINMISAANLSSQRESTFINLHFYSAKQKLNFKSDPKEIMNLYSISEFDEWFIRWFILMVKNEDLLSDEKQNPDAIFSLFPRIFNFFMSSDERKNYMHRYEFIHHKGINSIKFVKIETK